MKTSKSIIYFFSFIIIIGFCIGVIRSAHAEVSMQSTNSALAITVGSFDYTTQNCPGRWIPACENQSPGVPRNFQSWFSPGWWKAAAISSQDGQELDNPHTTPDTLAPGDLILKASSPDSLTAVTSDPNTGLVYAQANGGTDFYSYDPVVNQWSALAPSPLSSGNNGGAVFLDGMIYTVYTENAVSLGVYDVASNTWTTITNGLGLGTGVIASDGTFLYLASGTTFKKYLPEYEIWGDLTAPSIIIHPWGGMAYWNGRLYAHQGNGYPDFAEYEIATDTWTTLSDLPDGAVLGSAVDPVRSVYYAYGNYGGTKLYAFDLGSKVWSTITIPFFSVADGGLAYVPQEGFTGVYFVQGEGGEGFAYLESVPLRVGKFTFLPYAPEKLTSVTSDPSTGLIYAQQDNGTNFYAYNPLSGGWTSLADAPLNSGNNGGAAYLDGKIFTAYTDNSANLGVYYIASDSWITIPNGLAQGTGVIASDGTYLYLAINNIFKKYHPPTNFWEDLHEPSINIQPWGGMAYWNGRLYALRGNGYTDFAEYEIATDTWITLSDLPDGTVLGSAIDPNVQKYYASGNYGENNWYIYDFQSGSWSMETFPFFKFNDGGMAYSNKLGFGAIYSVQGESGVGFARYQASSLFYLPLVRRE